MQAQSQNSQSIFHSYKLLPLCLCIGVITNYFLTFHFAESDKAVLAYEYSPTLLFAVRHDIVIPYLCGMVLFYYAAGYFVSSLLANSDILLCRSCHCNADKHNPCPGWNFKVCPECLVFQYRDCTKHYRLKII